MESSGIFSQIFNQLQEHPYGIQVGAVLLGLLAVTIFSYMIFRLTFIALKISSVGVLIYFVISLCNLNPSPQGHHRLSNDSPVRFDETSDHMSNLKEKVHMFLQNPKKSFENMGAENIINLLQHSQSNKK